ncbi:MAG: hypothetical protein DRI75_11785 [Bacteroidetes bacterium]|nr:MAG: hypothetical protein DRI75_11785 [Bacteroidota bacterium]
MIKFFKKIRQRLLTENKFSKYLIYAVGEIVLVVFGILIALSINNWNVKKTQQKEIKEYAISLALDLEEDIEMTKTIMLHIKKINNRINKLSEYVNNNKINDLTNIDMLCLTWIKSNRPYKWNRATLEEIISSGSLRYINDNNLKKKIVEYDAFTHHLDEDFENDKAQSENATQLISYIVDINYPNIEELDKVLLDSNNPVADVNFYTTDAYQKAKDYNLKLITDDISKVKVAVSGFIRLKSNLRIRTEKELPDLINQAEELIGILKETYND